MTPVPGAVVELAPADTGTTPFGTVADGIVSGLSIPVSARSRLMLVMAMTIVGGIVLQTQLAGFVSGGAGIG
jgi:hypothetical protein